MSTPRPHHRKRAATSCLHCRQLKVRCDRQVPCSKCVCSNNSSCVYEKFPPKVLRTHASTPLTRPKRPSHTEVSDETVHVGETHELPVTGTEHTHVRVESSPHGRSPEPASSLQTNEPGAQRSRVTSTLSNHHNSNPTEFSSASQLPGKIRLFGGSHFMSGAVLIRDILELIDPHTKRGPSKISIGMQRAKSLTKKIKSQRALRWPTPQSEPLLPKDIADVLVDCYLQTFETLYRILHVPSFRRDYATFWSSTEVDQEFIILLKLVLAIGACMYDEEFSYRKQATHWIYEAQAWLAEPGFRSRLRISCIQIHLLLMLGQEILNIKGETVWISAGALLRTAMYMGLHRDPVHLPESTSLTKELRRRLWNTILEFTVQSSLASGGPPLISTQDFATQPPANVNDDELIEEGTCRVSAQDFTETTFAIALRKTFPLRLAIAKLLNGLHSPGPYEEILQLDKQLRALYKSLCHDIQQSLGEPGTSSNGFAIRAVDIIMNRYLMALHFPFVGQALTETIYTFSRKVVVECSLKIWTTAFPSSLLPINQSPELPWECSSGDWSRLLVYGSGFFHTATFQAAFIIAWELKTQLEEEQSLGPKTGRADLLAIAQQAKSWSFRCIEHGETNVRGYLFMCIILAHIHGLMRGMSTSELSRVSMEAAEDAIEKCLPILEKLVDTDASIGDGSNASEGLPLDLSSGDMEIWDFLAPSELFNSVIPGMMNWIPVT